MRIEKTININGRKMEFAVEDASINAGDVAGTMQLVALLHRIADNQLPHERAKDGQEKDGHQDQSPPAESR